MALAETLENRLALFQANEELASKPESVADGDNVSAASAKEPLPDPQAQAFGFPLRGNALNPILDASAPLLALALRLQDLTEPPDVDHLHKRLVNEIESIELELSRREYDRVTVTAYRYCLCAFLDETVMAHSWAAETDWASHSLLSMFHEETWAGDKFFTILERMLMEPQRYLHLLEFLYTCLCLGYEGKYGTYTGNDRLVQDIIRETRDVIRRTKGPREPLKLAHTENAMDIPHHIKWGTPVAAIIGGALVIACLLYAGFFLYTDWHVDRNLFEINEILGKERVR